MKLWQVDVMGGVFVEDDSGWARVAYPPPGPRPIIQLAARYSAGRSCVLSLTGRLPIGPVMAVLKLKHRNG